MKIRSRLVVSGVIVAFAAQAGCDGDDGHDDGASASAPATGSAGESGDASTGDSGAISTSRGSTDPTATATTTAGTTADGTTGVATTGADPAGTINVTLSGCSVDFSGNIVVSFNGSLGVASLSDGGGTLTGSFQFDLDGPATFTLSTQQRVDTGTVINMVDPAQGTWTNIDSDALNPNGVDSIGGVLTVSEWSPAEGRTSIEFSGVTLQNVVDQSDCTINGTIETDRLFP